MSEIKFEGQAALVTGASRGIGAAIALELAKRGLCVTGTATTDEGAAQISHTLATYPGCVGQKLDVNDGLAAEALVNSIVTEYGGLQVLVNNAGITRDMLAMRLKDDDWDAVLGVSHEPRRYANHDEAAIWPHHQHHLGGGRIRQCRSGQLRCGQGGCCRNDPCAGA